jgi:hypothetical protein
MRTLKEIYDEISPPEVIRHPEKAYRLSLKRIDGKIIGYTDKNGIHSYIDNLYTNLFKNKRSTADKVLEIGVWTGGSLVLWRDYFQKAKIYGIDVDPPIMELISEERIIQITADAYSDYVVNSLHKEFDIIIDDGPHTLESMIDCVVKYLPKLKSDGIMVIEDLKDISWGDTLMQYVPAEYQRFASVQDFRHAKNLSDDIAFVINLEET